MARRRVWLRSVEERGRDQGELMSCVERGGV